MYDSGVGEDVEHLLVMCGKFERDWWVDGSELWDWRMAGGI